MGRKTLVIPHPSTIDTKGQSFLLRNYSKRVLVDLLSQVGVEASVRSKKDELVELALASFTGRQMYEILRCNGNDLVRLSSEAGVYRYVLTHPKPIARWDVKPRPPPKFCKFVEKISVKSPVKSPVRSPAKSPQKSPVRSPAKSPKSKSPKSPDYSPLRIVPSPVVSPPSQRSLFFLPPSRLPSLHHPRTPFTPIAPKSPPKSIPKSPPKSISKNTLKTSPKKTGKTSPSRVPKAGAKDHICLACFRFSDILKLVQSKGYNIPPGTDKAELVRIITTKFMRKDIISLLRANGVKDPHLEGRTLAELRASLSGGKFGEVCSFCRLDVLSGKRYQTQLIVPK